MRPPFKKFREFIAQREAETRAVRGSQARIHGSDKGPMVSGRVVIETRACDESGIPVEDWKVREDDPNLVVTQAEQLMAQMAIGAVNAALNYIELGDPPFPATPPSLADVGLQASTGQRQPVSLTVSGNIVTCVATWTTTQGNGFTYTESGLFTGPFGSGLMFARKVFAGITKTNAFQMRFTWYITFLVNTSGGECSGVALIGPSTIASDTFYQSPSGGEASVAATFDFTVNAKLVDVFLNGARLVPGQDYTEANAPLNAPIGGPATNKGVNFNSFVLNPGDKVYLCLRAIS